MPTKDLLPGVIADSCPPAVVVDSRRAIIRARRRANARDTAHVLLLGGINYLFVNWPASHVPLLSRADSTLVVAAVNAAIITHILISRVIPRIRAKRIATTWCLSERARFFQPPRL
jgi:hypothetical protein